MMAAAEVEVPPPPPPSAKKALFVADLDANVTESQLYDHFCQVGPVTSSRICREHNTGRPLGYAYVNYDDDEHAGWALDMLNFSRLNGKPIRVSYSVRDPTIRKNGAANIFIKNLDEAIDGKALHETCSVFGQILSCKIATDDCGQSKGYGFVQFDSEVAAQKAIDDLNGKLLNNRPIYVGPFLRKQERETAVNQGKFHNVFIKNLSESTTEEDLKRIFGEYGIITSAVVMKDRDGNSKCFGFVNFVNTDDAAKAVEALNGRKFDGKEWYVGKALKKIEREMESKGQVVQSVGGVDKFQGSNLYMKNLDDSIGDDKLRELFSEFGTITSCKVMRDPNGVSRGSGFVAFSTPEEASRSLAEMNGKMVFGKPIYVAIAQRKEDRKARLQAQFSQMRPHAIAPYVGPRMPMYPLGGPGLGQPMFYGQGPPGIIPQPGFGYRQQFVPGMRLAGPPMPNFFVPMVQHQGQRHGGRRAGVGPIQSNQQPLPLMPPQMLPRGFMYHYPTGRNMPGMPGVAGNMLPVSYDNKGLVLRDAALPLPVPVHALASALANATPEHQRTMLGENLYPLVNQLEHDNAAKVTGMLLEMDQTEVLHLLESPEALKSKVAEAMEVLKNASQPQSNGNVTAQLASLSLNDSIVA
ncbi:hypothetical protein Scep_020215 [Stephania cephalantha]|uniref:Polyadenylate-binding protein n=1 Tax=Stephania cephalantha TaxID=152367 RepID=A0AAP0ID91_9MAGN